jgi:hypothetical protein
LQHHLLLLPPFQSLLLGLSFLGAQPKRFGIDSELCFENTVNRFCIFQIDARQLCRPSDGLSFADQLDKISALLVGCS